MPYPHSVNSTAYGLEVVEKLQLNLKSIAKVLAVKKVKMADVKQVENSTGYILGGVSPLGQKKKLLTIIDNSVQLFDLVYISGGKRGLELALNPSDLARLSQANFAGISNKATKN